MLSKDQFVLVKRMVLNVLSGNERFLSVNRAALGKGFPERFLIERGWVIRGTKLTFNGTQEQMRTYLDELQGVELAPAGESSVGQEEAASPRLMKRLAEAIAREEKRPGVWSFPCVFRMSAAELSKMLSLDDGSNTAARVASAARQLLRDGIVMEGRLEVTETSSFVYSRSE